MNRYCAEHGITIEKQPGDDEILKAGTVDFLSFSYYMSSCQSADPSKQSGEGNIIGGVPNPYLETSDWGWQIDPKGLRYGGPEVRAAADYVAGSVEQDGLYQAFAALGLLSNQ